MTDSDITAIRDALSHDDSLNPLKDHVARLLDALESAQRLQPVLVPQPDDCEVDYSTGHQVGYAQGWNAAVAAMKDAP